MNAGIAALDKSVAEATEQRKEENSDYTTLMANDAAAADILAMAKNRLNKFYNPKSYKEPEAAPAFVQVSAHKQLDAPPAAPEAPKAYSNAELDSGKENVEVELAVAECLKKIEGECIAKP